MNIISLPCLLTTTLDLIVYNAVCFAGARCSPFLGGHLLRKLMIIADALLHMVRIIDDFRALCARKRPPLSRFLPHFVVHCTSSPSAGCVFLVMTHCGPSDGSRFSYISTARSAVLRATRACTSLLNLPKLLFLSLTFIFFHILLFSPRRDVFLLAFRTIFCLRAGLFSHLDLLTLFTALFYQFLSPLTLVICLLTLFSYNLLFYLCWVCLSLSGPFITRKHEHNKIQVDVLTWL